MRIPIGRMYSWAREMRQGLTPDEFSRLHLFRNAEGWSLEESAAKGLSGDPWCTVCGKHRRLHVSEAEWDDEDMLTYLLCQGTVIRDDPMLSEEIRRQSLCSWLNELAARLQHLQSSPNAKSLDDPDENGNMSPSSTQALIDKLIIVSENDLGEQRAHQAIAVMLASMPSGGEYRPEWIADLDGSQHEYTVDAARVLRLLFNNVRGAA